MNLQPPSARFSQDRSFDSNLTTENSSDFIDTDKGSVTSYKNTNPSTPPKPTWKSLFTTSFSIFNTNTSSSSSTLENKSEFRSHGWMAFLMTTVNTGPMRRLQESILGTGKTNLSTSSDIWLLGVCYRFLLPGDDNKTLESGSFISFQQDFSSRIWMTYRKGFDAIGNTKFTSDVNWGCMIRSSQMLVAQALVFHYLGRSWRWSLQKPYDPKYVEIIKLFGDTKDSVFSIHNLLVAGKGHGLAAGSWVGPYAMCRTWEVLASHSSSTWKDGGDLQKQNLSPSSLPNMVVYIVSGDEDGERGGAPVVHIDDVSCRLSSSKFQTEESSSNWTPVLLLVPLVLGLDKVSPRYIPLLRATFTFPQSLGILGGRPGASTYIIGVQDDNAIYLDPHEVQSAVDISKDEFDTSSYHCSMARHLPLEQIDPSLAIGFYCRNKDDFEDFCSRTAKLADTSNGTPLFTVAQSQQISKIRHQTDIDTCEHEDDWQLLL